MRLADFSGFNETVKGRWGIKSYLCFYAENEQYCKNKVEIVRILDILPRIRFAKFGGF